MCHLNASNAYRAIDQSNDVRLRRAALEDKVTGFWLEAVTRYSIGFSVASSGDTVTQYAVMKSWVL